MNLPNSKRPLRRALVAALTALAAATVAPTAAHAAGVELETAYAGPIAASSALCTAEPRAYVYGTTNYDPTKPLSFASKGIPGYGYYEPPNAPSWLDLAPAGAAGGRADLCAGVTFTPDVEPLMMRDLVNDERPRLPDDPAWPDVAETHVAPASSGAAAPVGDDPRSLSINLPAGYTADLAAITPCTDADFGLGNYAAPGCATTSQVGEAFARVSGFATIPPATSAAIFHTPATGIKLYVLPHSSDELARLGFSFKPASSLAPVKMVARLLLAADGSGRETLSFTSAPRATYDATAIAAVGTQWAAGDTISDAADPRIGQPVPTATVRQLYLEGLSVRLWGAASAHAGLTADIGTWGSRCDTTVSGDASAVTYNRNTSTAAATPVSLSGCTDLGLPVSAAFSTTEHAADTPTGATLTVDLPQPGGALAPALARSIRVRLPDGVEPGIQFAADTSGTTDCTLGQFGSGSVRVANACPAASRIGTAQLQTTLGGAAFSGSVYVGPVIDAGTDPNATPIASILVDAATPGAAATDAPRIKLQGQLIVSPTGGTQVAFDDLPTIRLTQLRVTFDVGESALFTTPPSCGTSSGSVGVQSGGAGPATTIPLSLAITSSCAHSTAASLDLAGTTAGSAGRDATSVTISRQAGDAPLTAATITLPPGELLTPFTGIPCDTEAAHDVDCPDSSHLGSIRIAAGPRTAQATLTGGIYLTTAPDDQAAAGALLVADATAPGGIDLGRFVAPARFDTRPGAGLTLSVELPRLLGGARLDLRSLTIDLDDDGTIISPTSCGSLSASATVTSPEGSASTNAATTSYPGCGTRAFAPAFGAQAPADASGHARVALQVNARGGDSSLRSLAVTMPAGLSVDKSTAARTCSPDQFSAGACPAASRVGSAAEQLAIASDVIGGDIYAMPGSSIGIAYAGRFAHRVTGELATGADGRAVLKVATMPDLPVSRLSLSFDGGASGLYARAATGCDATKGWSAVLGAQGGQSATRAAATTCATASAAPRATTKVVPSHLEFSISPKTGLKLKMNAFGGRKLQSAKLTLPKALRFDTKAVKRKKQVAVVVLGAKSKTSFTGGSLLLVLTGGPAQEAVVRVRTTAYVTAASKAKSKAKGSAAKKAKGKLETFRLRLAFADGSVETPTIKARLG